MLNKYDTKENDIMTELENQKKEYFKWKREIINRIEKDDFKSEYYKAFLFAIENDIYPYSISIPEITNEEEIDLYKDFFVIKKSFISDVLTKADGLYAQKKSISFYEYEDEFGKDFRNDLILIFRCMFLSKKFQNYNFWNILIDHEHNPDEANWIIEE